MANQQVNKILESDEKDLVILNYLATKVFQKTPENEKQRQWWMANSEFTEHDLDLIVSTADLFQPAKNLDKSPRAHLKYSGMIRVVLVLLIEFLFICFSRRNTLLTIWRWIVMLLVSFCSREVSPNDPGLRNLVKKIRDSAAFWKSSRNGRHRPKQMAYDRYRLRQRRYFSYSDKRIGGADSAVTYSGLRDLVKRIRGSAAFRESLGMTEVPRIGRSIWFKNFMSLFR